MKPPFLLSSRLVLLLGAGLLSFSAWSQSAGGGEALRTQALSLADATQAQVIAWRRHIHQHPELSYQEVQTAAYVAEALKKMPGIEVQTGIAKTGIKAVLRGGKPGPVVALRADMDALPVEERNDLPFKSTAKGNWLGKEVPVFHACGHDTHVAMLLGAAQALSQMRADLPGTVVFLFQPAEEQGPGPVLSGAPAMVQAGVLDLLVGSRGREDRRVAVGYVLQRGGRRAGERLRDGGIEQVQRVRIGGEPGGQLGSLGRKLGVRDRREGVPRPEDRMVGLSGFSQERQPPAHQRGRQVALLSGIHEVAAG